jgi:hypothetical protein
VWLGETGATDFPAALHLPATESDAAAAVERVYEFLHDRGVLFRPW